MTIPQTIETVKGMLRKDRTVSNAQIVNLLSLDDMEQRAVFLDQVRNQLIQTYFAEDDEQLGLKIAALSRDPEYDVFISYSRKDNQSQRVDQIYETLVHRYNQKSGRTLRVFFDTREIHGGDDWELRLGDGIKQSKVMISIISESYFKSKYCHWEWQKYSQQEIGLGLMDQGILPVYIILVNPSLFDDEDEKKDWMKNLKDIRHWVDIANWFEKGEKVLMHDDAHKSFESLSDFCINRVDRLSRIMQSQSNLPLHFSRFYGRRDDLRNMREILNCKQPPVLALYGMPGIGKSTLAYEYGLAYADRYDGGRFFIKASGMQSILSELRTLMILELGWQFTDEEKKDDALAYARIKQHFEAPHAINQQYYTLLIFDNVEDPDKHFSTLQIDKWLSGGVHVVISSRQKPRENQWLIPLAVEALSPTASLSLLSSYRSFPEQKDKEAGELIVDKLAGHPIALNLAGVFMQKAIHQTYHSFLKQLEKDDIGSLTKMGEDKNIDLHLYEQKVITSLFIPMLDTLSPVEKRAVQYAALLPPDSVPLPWLEELLTEDFPEQFTIDEDDRFFLSPWKNIETKLVNLSIWNESETAELVRMHRILQAIVRKDETTMALQEKVVIKLVDKARILTNEWYVKQNKWMVETLRKFVPQAQKFSGNISKTSDLFNNLGLIDQDLGDLLRARELMEKAVAIKEINFAPDHPSLAISYSNLGAIEQDLGHLTRARELMEKAVAIDEKNFAPDHPSLARSYSNLGTAEKALANLARARELMEKAVAIDEKNFAPDYPSLATRYSNLGLIERDLGHLIRAREQMEKAVAIKEKNFAPDHPSLAICYSNLGLIEQDLGNLPRARELMEKAVGIGEKNFSPDHPSLATSYCNLGMIERDLGELPRARELMEKAVAIDEKNFAPDHPSLAIRCSNLGLIEHALGDLPRARELMEKAVGIGEKNFAPDHPSLAIDYSNLGMIERDLGNFPRGRKLMEKAIATGEKIFTPNHPSLSTMYSNLGQIELVLGNLPRARELMGKALTIDEKNFAPDHPSLATSYSNLGLIGRDLGELTRAREQMEKAVAIGEKNFTPNHPTLAAMYSNLGMIEQDLGELTRAREQMEKAVAIGEKIFKPDHSTLAAMYSNLGMIERDLGDLPRARELMEKAMAIGEKIFAPDHPSLATSYLNLGLIDGDLGDLLRARELMKKAVAIGEKNFAPEHPFLATTYSNLGQLEQGLGNLLRARELMEKAVAIDEKNFAPDHLSLASSYFKLGLVEQALDNIPRARDLIEKAVAIEPTNESVNMATFLFILSNLELQMQNRDNAIELGIRSYEILKKLHSGEHRDIQDVLAYLFQNFPELFEGGKS